MKRHLIFLFMGVSLVLLAACSVVDSEQGWTTISQSKPGEPSYSLQAKDNRYRILFEENASTRMDWYLNNYQPGLNLKMRTLNSKHLKNTVGGSAKQELSGRGYADFTMVYETSYKPQVERTYFKVLSLVRQISITMWSACIKNHCLCNCILTSAPLIAHQ